MMMMTMMMIMVMHGSGFITSLSFGIYWLSWCVHAAYRIAVVSLLQSDPSYTISVIIYKRTGSHIALMKHIHLNKGCSFAMILLEEEHY
jgi:hypothetical protein